MSYAALDAARVARAARACLETLAQTNETSETHQRKVIMIERIGALAGAAADSNERVTLTSEEFWLLSRNW